MRSRRWLVAFAIGLVLAAVLASPGVPALRPASFELPAAERNAAAAAAVGGGEPARREPALDAPTGDDAEAAVDVACAVVRGYTELFPGAEVRVELAAGDGNARTLHCVADAAGMVRVRVAGTGSTKVTFGPGAPDLCGAPVTVFSLRGHEVPPARLVLQPIDAWVRGVVTDEHDRPLEGARVSWRRDTAPELTDAAGRFECRVPSSTRDFRCLFLAPGRVSHREAIVLSPGAAIELRVRLLPGARVSGRVTDRDGAAVPGAVVETILQRIAGGAAVSDVNGHYEVDCTMGGERVQVTVRRAGHVPASAWVETRNGDATQDFVLQPAGTVRGQVLLPDGSPAAGARVSTQGGHVFGDTGASAVADATGTFELTELPPGGLGLQASLRGFAPASATVDVAAGRTADVRIVLQSGVAVHGRVVDENGRPVRDAEVRAPTASASTDALGNFTLAGLPPGPVVVAVLHVDHRELRDLPLSASGANRIELQRAGALRGRVVDARTGLGVDDFTVSLVGGDTEQGSIGVDWVRVGQRFQRTAGHWATRELMLVPGSTWRVRVTAPGYAATVATLAATIEPGLVQDIALTTGARVAGRLTFSPTMLPLANAAVRLLDHPPGERVFHAYEPRARSGPTGGFEFAATAPGRVWLAVDSAGMAPCTLGPFLVGAGDCELGELRVGVGGAITGTLRDADGRALGDHPLAAHSVHADSTSPTCVQTRTDADGSFAFTGLAPGTWRLYGSIAAPGGDVAIDQRVQVDGGSQRIDVRPAGTGSLRGVVRGTWPKDTQPMVVVHRIVAGGDEVAAGSSASTVVQDGGFAVLGLAPGRYSVSVMLADTVPPRHAHAAVTVGAGAEPVVVTLDLATR